MTELADVRWIGGGSGAGKSTVAELLARSGATAFATDDRIAAHARAAADDPLVRSFTEASMDERWVRRSPEEMLRTFPWFRGAAFDLLLDDVRALPGTGPVVVEGFRLLPRLVAPLLGSGGRAVFLLPPPAMRAAAFGVRHASRSFWTRTSDPDRALANLLERDRLFTEGVRAEAAALRLPVLEVDGTEPATTVARRAAALLDLAQPPLPVPDAGGRR